jgi:hypothetical protein
MTLLLLVLSAVFLGCGGGELKAFELPLKNMRWGMSVEEAIKAVGTQPDEEISQEGLTQLLWKETSILGEKASLHLRFDKTKDSGLFFAVLEFADVSDEKVLEKLKKEYGAPDAEDPAKSLYTWESIKISGLPEDKQEAIKELLFGDASVTEESIWNQTKEEALVMIQLQHQKAVFTAEHMAAYRNLGEQ